VGWTPVVNLDETIEANRSMLKQARNVGMPVIYSVGKKGIDGRADRMHRDSR